MIRGHLQSVPGQPIVEFIQNRLGFFLAYSSPFVGFQTGDFPFKPVELLDIDQRLLGNLALIALCGLLCDGEP